MSRQTFSFFFLSVCSQLSRPGRHPSIRTLCERSSLGARWVFSFSRCCYLIIDPSSVDDLRYCAVFGDKERIARLLKGGHAKELPGGDASELR